VALVLDGAFVLSQRLAIGSRAALPVRSL
jgi:hypothetical protein